MNQQFLTMRLSMPAPFTRVQVKILIVFAILYSVALILSRHQSARDPGSYFFQPNQGYKPEYSLARVQEATEYISRFNQTRPPSAFGPTNDTSLMNTKICVGIVTIKRPLAQMLDVTVGSILDNLTPSQRATLSIHVLFAHDDPSDHPSFVQPWIRVVVDDVITYNETGAPPAELQYYDNRRHLMTKSLFDYRQVLRSCSRGTEAPLILMLEDDVVAQRNWYAETMRAIATVTTLQQRNKIGRWLYLRLFYTEKFLGWNSEHWPFYIQVCLVAVILPALLGTVCRQRIRGLRSILSNKFLAVVCIFCVPMTIILVFLTGHVTVWPMQRGVHVMNKFGCCSQALLFPRHEATSLMDSMETLQIQSPVPIDSAIEFHADENRLDRLALVPSQFQHVGAASYKENRESYSWEGQYHLQGAHGVWSMGFEKAWTL